MCVCVCVCVCVVLALSSSAAIHLTLNSALNVLSLVPENVCTTCAGTHDKQSVECIWPSRVIWLEGGRYDDVTLWMMIWLEGGTRWVRARGNGMVLGLGLGL